MHTTFLQAQVPQPKSTIDFKQTAFEFEEKDVHHLDYIDMQRKIGEKVYSIFTQATITAPKMQLSLNNF